MLAQILRKRTYSVKVNWIVQYQYLILLGIANILGLPSVFDAHQTCTLYELCEEP